MPANIVVPPASNLFTLPTSLVSTSLVSVPGVGPAPQIGFGPLGGVAPYIPVQV